MMPKWMVAFIAAALAGITGFACGALLTRPHRQEIASDRQALEDRLQKAQDEIVRLSLEADSSARFAEKRHGPIR